MKIITCVFILTLAIPFAATAQKGNKVRAAGVLLEDLSWPEAAKLLTPDTVVVVPLGAAAKEHGPHLKLKNDWLIAEYLKNRIVARSRVVIAPTITIPSVANKSAVGLSALSVEIPVFRM